nr:rho-associated protein kinase 1-like [Aedes albopictus]
MPNYFSTEGFGVKVPQEQLISKQEKAIETVKNNQQYNDKIKMLEKQLMHIQENYKNETDNSQKMKKQLTELRLSKSDVEKKAKDLQSQVISLQAAQDTLQKEVADLRTRIPLESARIQMTELQKELEGKIHSLVGNLDRSVTREQQAIEDNRNLSDKISEVENVSSGTDGERSDSKECIRPVGRIYGYSGLRLSRDRSGSPKEIPTEKKVTSIESELKAVQSRYNQEVKEPQTKLNKAKVACQKIDYRQTQQRLQKLEGEYRHESEKVLALHSQLEQEQNKKSSLLSELSLQSSEAAHLKDKETQLVKKVQQFQETKRKKKEVIDESTSDEIIHQKQNKSDTNTNRNIKTSYNIRKRKFLNKKSSSRAFEPKHKKQKLNRDGNCLEF